MKTFCIDRDGHLFPRKSGQPTEGLVQFDSEEQLLSLAEHWPTRRIVDIWNNNKLGGHPVNRFTDRKTAVSRIWKAVQNVEATVGKAAGTAASKKAGAARKPKAKQPRTSRRQHSKSSRVIALLERSDGATLKALMRATGWQAHSVRGFLSGQLRKKLGLRLKSFERDGQRVYSIRR